MRIILDQSVDNDNIPVIYPQINLINENLVAGYDMRSNLDFSGNRNHFTFGGTFNSQGAVLTPDAISRIDTPAMDSAGLTVVICANVPSAADPGIILSNAQTGPTQGFEVRKLANSTNAQLQIAITNGSGFASGSYSFAGWRMNIFTLNGSELKASNGAGSQTTLSFGGARRLGLVPWRMNGNPAGMGAAGITAGVTGTLGMALFYNKVYTQAELVPIAESVRQVMALRGVAV